MRKAYLLIVPAILLPAAARRRQAKSLDELPWRAMRW
jgi:hypothetical protein